MSIAPSPRKPDRIDTITASVVQGALENIAVEMGYKLMRMSLFLDHPRVRGFRRGAGRCRGPRPGRIGAVDAAAVGADPRLYPRHPEGAGGARRQVRPGDVIMHNDAYGGASHGPDVGLRGAGVHRGPTGRVRGDDCASSRHRRAVPRQLRHRRCDRRLCRGAPVQGDQGLRPRRRNDAVWQIAARQHPGVRSRGRRHGSADRRRAHRRRAAGRADRALWAAIRPRPARR